VVSVQVAATLAVKVCLTGAHRSEAGGFSVSKYHNPSTVGWRVG